MFRIRQEQLDALSEDALARFKASLLEEMARFAPKLFDIRGEESFRQLIDLGISKAGEHSFTKRGPIRLFIQAMLAYGCDFDSDLQLHQVTALLRNPNNLEQMQLADRLFAELQRFNSATKGENNRYAIAALQRLHSSAVFSDAHFQNNDIKQLISQLRQCYPEKVDYVGEEWLGKLFEHARQGAEDLGLPNPEGPAILLTLMFAMGQGVLRDPMYPWVHATLTDQKYGTAAERLRKLTNKAQHYLAATLQYLPT